MSPLASSITLDKDTNLLACSVGIEVLGRENMMIDLQGIRRVDGKTSADVANAVHIFALWRDAYGVLTSLYDGMLEPYSALLSLSLCLS